jgi:hypothetical protein
MIIGKGRAMRWNLSHGDRRFRRQGKDLAQESEAYLSGHYADYVETRNEDVPNWAWISVLAQADPELLRSLVKDNALYAGVRMRTSVWWQAVVFLAGEILSQRNDDRDLDELRRSVLVPLELKWSAANRPPERPGELVRSVLSALDQYPSSRRR